MNIFATDHDSIKYISCGCAPSCNDNQVFIAATNGHADQILELVSEGANINFKDEVCHTLALRNQPFSSCIFIFYWPILMLMSRHNYWMVAGSSFAPKAEWNHFADQSRCKQSHRLCAAAHRERGHREQQGQSATYRTRLYGSDCSLQSRVCA